MRTIDDNEIEEVVEQPNTQTPAMRTIGDDEIEEEQGFLGKALDTATEYAPMLNPLGDVFMDFGKGAAEGATLGSADELGGMIGTGAEKLLSYIPGTKANDSKKIDDEFTASGGKIEGQSLADTYKSYQKGVEQDFNEASERSPYVNFGGNLAGSIASGVAAGKLLGIGESAAKGKKAYDMWKDGDKLKAGLQLLKNGGKAYAKAAPGIALESALNSEGNIVGENSDASQVGEDVLGGLAFGLPAVLGMQGISDVAVPAAKEGVQKAVQSFDDFADDNPFVRKAKKAFAFGEQGINPVSEKSREKILAGQVDKTKGLLGDIKAADKKLGQEVGASLENADKAGVTVDISKPVNRGMKVLQEAYNTFGDNVDEVADTLTGFKSESRGRQVFSNIANNMGAPVRPLEAKEVLDDIDAFIGKFNASGNRTPQQDGILDSLYVLRDQISNEIKTQIPEYGAAAQRFAEFRKFVPETIISGETPVDVSKVYMGKLKNSDKNLYSKLDKLATESTAQGSGSENVNKAMNNLKQGMGQFHMNENMRGDVNPLDHHKMINQIRDYSDEAQMLRDMQTVKSPTLNGNVLAQAAQMSKEGALRTANVAGRVTKPLTNLSKKVYNMPAEKLSQYADLMEKTPGLSVYGKALKEGLQNGDQAKKNAALFSIMQNPNARIIFNDNENEE